MSLNDSDAEVFEPYESYKQNVSDAAAINGSCNHW